MTKKIKLSENIFAIVDDFDYEYLSEFKWYLHNAGYAVRDQYLGRVNGKKKKKCILMHRVINDTPDNMHTDHKNGNKLDNRKENLRACTMGQNMCNVKARTNKVHSKYKGVSWDYKNKKWHVKITKDKKTINLGRFISEVEAGVAYNKAALKHFGEFALLNKVG